MRNRGRMAACRMVTKWSNNMAGGAGPGRGEILQLRHGQGEGVLRRGEGEAAAKGAGKVAPVQGDAKLVGPASIAMT